MKNLRRVSLSLLLMFLMAATSFTVLASVPASAGQGPANVSTSAPEVGKAAGMIGNADNLDLKDKMDGPLFEKIKESSGPFRVYVAITDRVAANKILAEKGLPIIKGKEFQGLPTVRVLDLTSDQIRALAASPATQRIITYERPVVNQNQGTTPATDEAPTAAPPAVEDYDVDVLHGAADAWMNGYTGNGVKIALIDTGFDMAHPDLQGQQARYSSGFYAGWPIAYDDLAAAYWSGNQIGGWVADTTATVSDLGGYVEFDGRAYDISDLRDVSGNPVTSQSGVYHIGYHTDANLEALMGERVGVLVVDAVAPGVYDTVYVDILDDASFSNDKACTQGDEISYFDFYNAATGIEDRSMWNAGDGFADLSGGMVYWISDGANVLPGSDWIYGADFTPASGDAVAFVGEFSQGQSHGTMTASAALAQGRTLGGQLMGMAPDAKLICIPFTLNDINEWLFAEFGADGTYGTGDEANIVSNSYGWSDTTVNAGYNLITDLYPGFIDYLGGRTLWCWSTGNGGPGYGTVHSVVDPMSIHVGAGTTMQYRYWLGYESDLAYTKWGDVAPFSNSGPSRQGKLNAEIIASGMYSLEPAPLNEPDNYYSLGDGSMHFQLGSGTSHATPTVAGAAALGYQAYYDALGYWPYTDDAKAKLMAAADDMHFDPLKQGAGWLNANTFAQAMDGSGGTSTIAWAGYNEPFFTKAALYPGTYNGTRYETFANFLLPGQYDDTHILYTTNYDPVNTVNVDVSSSLLLKTDSQRIDLVTPDAGSQYVDITGYIAPTTDLLKVTLFMPFSEFDPNFDYNSDVAYMLELHDWVDFNHDGMGWNSTSSGELFRYTVDGSDSNYNQVMIKDPIDRTHDGLMARIRSVLGAAGVNVSLQIDTYELQTFPWIQFRMVGDTVWQSSLNMVLPAYSGAAWEVNVSVPLDTPIGTYAAAIYVDDGNRIQSVPVVINVPASDFEFEFGGTPLFDTPYSNHITGVADKGWRFEVGDWRQYWAVPTTTPPNTQASLIAVVNWTELPTDVNMHILAPMPDIYGAPQLDLPYGPSLLMTAVASSDEKYMGGGTFGVYTDTGRAQEVLAAPFGSWWDMWGMGPEPFSILTRCPVMSGSEAYDTISGYTTWVTVDNIQPASPYVYNDQPGPSTGTISASYDVVASGPLEVRGNGTGPFMTSVYPNEAIWQDSMIGDFVYDLANAVYTRAVQVSGSSMLSVSTMEVSGAPDIDLGVWYDSNADGIAELSEPYRYMGITGSTEYVQIDNPADGQYLIKVLGYSVTGTPGLFDLTVRIGVPGYIKSVDLESPVTSGTHEFNISYSVPAELGVFTGTATFGFLGADNSFSIDVTIEVVDAGPPEIQNISPAPSSYVGTNNLEVSFTVNDHVNFFSGVDWSTLQVNLDDKIDMVALSAIYTDTENALLVFPYTISEGRHHVDIRCADLYGNMSPWNTSEFIVDSRVEVFTAELLDPNTGYNITGGAVVPLDTVDIDGYTDNFAAVDVVAQTGVYSTVADSRGHFFVSGIALVEGLNVLTLDTMNLAGIRASMTKMVISDTICTLIVLEPMTPTADSALDVKGLTELGASVEVNGVVATVESDGGWSADVTLVEGTNDLWVNATDAVGNMASRMVEVVLDTTSPALSIDSPADGSTTSEPSVTVSGTTEAGATVTVNGVLASDGTADWSATVVLSEGTNTIVVTAKDALGNSVTQSITVEYIPPVYVTPAELAAVRAELLGLLSNLSANLTTNVSALQGEIDALAASLTENVSDLQSQLDGLNAALGENVSDLQGQIDMLTTDLAADVARLNGLIDSLEAALAQNVTSLQNQITNQRNEMNAMNNTLHNNIDNLQNDLENQIDDLNQTTQNDIGAVDEKAKDTDAFASMLMYLTLILFAIAVMLVGAVWYVMNGKIKGGGSGGSQAMEEVQAEPPSDVEKEFEDLKKEIKQDEL